MTRSVPARVAVVLFVLFFAGLAVTVFTFVDLRWTHWMLGAPGDPRGAVGGKGKDPVDATELNRLRRSILNVRVSQCGLPGERTGTAFVVKAGYVATAAHILGNQQDCNGPIRLIDHKGLEHTATLEGVSDADDLALLRIGDMSLPPLRPADTTQYESPNELVRLVTIGYPLEDAGASSRDDAGISGEGNLSRYDRQNNVFVTSGLNLNPGNSGGPIFIRQNWTVLGIARAKLPNAVGDGIGYVASMKAFQQFFRDRTGQELQ